MGFSSNESIPTRAIDLRKGKYIMRFNAEATRANNIMPYFVIGLSNYMLKDMYHEKGKKDYLVKFELPEKTLPGYCVNRYNHSNAIFCIHTGARFCMPAVTGNAPSSPGNTALMDL